MAPEKRAGEESKGSAPDRQSPDPPSPTSPKRLGGIGMGSGKIPILRSFRADVCFPAATGENLITLKHRER